MVYSNGNSIGKPKKKKSTVTTGEPILVKVSHYEPSAGGVNCASFVNGECVSKMANGERWQDWIDVAVACPQEIPFESKIIIGGKEWVCKDRGGAIVFDGTYYWIDQLTYSPEYEYGQIVEATLIK